MSEMWKNRVRLCLDKAIGEMIAEAEQQADPDMTIRTELDQMVRKTKLADLAKRLREIQGEIEAVPERRTKAAKAKKT